MPSEPTDHFDYLVVGGGCIGVSVAYALQREYPNGKIALVEGSAINTASKDINKTIRTPYFDHEYVLLAEEAKRRWETELPYCKFYRKTGWVQVVRGEYKPFFTYPNERLIGAQDLSYMVHSREPSILRTDENLWYSEDIGVVSSSLALEAVAKEAAGLGVKRLKTDVLKLLIGDGVCHGVQGVEGINFAAETTIIATGPWTPTLLGNSDIKLPSDLEGFFTVAASGVASLPLDADEYEKFKSMPILVTQQGEIMPPDPEHKLLRITSTDTFELAHLGKLQSEVCSQRRATINALVEKMIPELKEKGRKLEYWHCADLLTPHQHPLLDEVPGVRGAHLAVGGSYHLYKFLPVLGDIVVQYLQGKRIGVSKRWTWSRSEERNSIHAEMVPKDRT